jgi:hypothetical protein
VVAIADQLSAIDIGAKGCTSTIRKDDSLQRGFGKT